MNSLCVSGRLVADPELKQTTSGKSVASFRLANTEGYGEKKKTNWLTCVAWEKTAEALCKYVAKGDKVLIRGTVGSREYERDGAKRTVIEVKVDELEFLETKRKSDAAPAPADYGSQTNDGYEEVNTDDSDFPF